MDLKLPSSPWTEGKFRLELYSREHRRQKSATIKEDPIIDSETGEILTLTKSKWTSDEGRINIDFDSIVKAGTGVLAIKERINNTQPKSFDNDDFSPNPLMSKFFNDGPLTPVLHRHFNPKTGKIETPKMKSRKKLKRHTSPQNSNTVVASDEHECEADQEVKYFDNNDIVAVVETSSSTSEMVSSAASSMHMYAEIEEKIFLELYAMAKELYALRYPNRTLRRNRPAESKSPQLRSRHILSNLVSSSTESRKLSSISNSVVQGKAKSLSIVPARVPVHGSPPALTAPVAVTAHTPPPSTDVSAELDHARAILAGCKEIASRKVKNLRELHQAILDESHREKLRQSIEKDLDPSKSKTKDIIAKHEVDRQKGRIYIKSLQHDNESRTSYCSNFALGDLNRGDW